jgi:polar amino acid transport system substrate-binding protein
MKKFSKVAIISFILGVAILFTACANSATSNDTKDTLSKIDEIKKAGKIVVGTSADYPPYEFRKEIDGNSEFVGFDIEIAKEIAKSLDVELEIKDMAFDGLLMALNADKVDFVIAGMVPKPERAKVVDFSKIYYLMRQRILINKDNIDTLKTVEDLSGKRIGVQKATTQEDAANAEIKDPQIKALEKLPDIILDLKNNKIDAVVIEETVGRTYASKSNDLMLIDDVAFKNEQGGTAVAVKKGNTDLVDLINNTLDTLMKDGSIDKFVTEAIEMVDEL